MYKLSLLFIIFFCSISMFSQLKMDTVYNYRIETNSDNNLIREYFLLSEDGKKVMIRTINEGQVVSEVYYYNKLKHGIFRSFWEDGKDKEKSSWSEGVQHGKAFFYYPSGILKQVTNHKNGILDGEVKEFYQNGNLKYVGYYVNNVRVGVWKSYSIEGVIIKTKKFE